MGGKRNQKRGRLGVRGKTSDDKHSEGFAQQSSRKEPPSRQSQRHDLNRDEHSAVFRRSHQPQEPPSDCSGNDRRSKTRRAAGSTSKPVTHAEKKRIDVSTVIRLDPPDDIQSFLSSRRNDHRNGHSIIHHNKQPQCNVEDDSPLLDEREQMQYKEYEDQRYCQQQINAPDPGEIQQFSSSHRQFTLAPLKQVEMTSLNNGKSAKERKAKKEERRLQQQQRAQQSHFSQGRYDYVSSSQSESDDESDNCYDDDDDDECTDHGRRRHEEFYNYDYEEADSTDEDEERPLRRPRSSNKRRNDRESPPILTHCERVQNRALVAAFALVALLFVRDHTPWWKKHTARVEIEKYHHHHGDGSDDDDSVRNVKLDPMAVYNSNDDDSTHTKDHDPLHQYIKEDNKYNEHSAGERISSRPAQKSLNHGFMDEAYENRPEAKNSASTAAATAGVRMSDSNTGVNEEEAAFLKSVKGKTNQYSDRLDVGKRDQIIPPPPPVPEHDATSFPSKVEPQSAENIIQPADSMEGQMLSLSTEFGTEQQQQHQQQYQVPIHEFSDNLVEWGELHKKEAEQLVQNTFDLPESNDFQRSSQYVESNLSSAALKPMANEAMSGSAFMSSSLQAKNAQDIKDVYKDSYYRWNHPFREHAADGDGRDVPVFWRIPRSASSIVEEVMSYCYHLAVASALGTRQGHDQDQTLAVVQFGNARYVNVDMSNPAGIDRARVMNLGTSGVADAISTPFLFEAASIFEDVPDSGKCFTMLRHPVDRAISLYHRYQSDDSNPNTAQYKGLSIDEYAEKSTESNWLVRFLTNKRAGALSWHDLESAKEVFGRKCLVGLVEKAEESIRRYERFFNWSDNTSNCVGDRLANSDKRNQHNSYEGTSAWEVLRKKNEYDVLLYEYAKNLYTQQSTMYENFH